MSELWLSDWLYWENLCAYFVEVLLKFGYSIMYFCIVGGKPQTQLYWRNHMFFVKLSRIKNGCLFVDANFDCLVQAKGKVPSIEIYFYSVLSVEQFIHHVIVFFLSKFDNIHRDYFCNRMKSWILKFAKQYSCFYFFFPWFIGMIILYSLPFLSFWFVDTIILYPFLFSGHIKFLS